jgi:hypothetical protein
VVGTVLDGRYRILRKLGEGGMGEVYLVEHLSLHRNEALKILRPHLVGDPKFVSRFRREARATNRVQHPHIVSVYDFGQLPDGRFYLAMEYADGETLDHELRRIGTFPVPRALHVLHQLADAIDHAHSCGVVHRDLKPENLSLVTHRGRTDVLKVLDFGVAKIIAPEYSESMKLSREGEMYGTARYMAPEQFGGNTSDPRIDIYAFGCIAFELIVGEPPFRGHTAALLHAHLSERPVAASQRNPTAEVPPELDALILRCLEKKADKRFQTGHELAIALERVPGYARYRASSEKRRLQTLRAMVPELVAGPDEVTRHGTEHGHWTGAQPDEAGGPEERRAVLVELADALLDRGEREVALVLTVSALGERKDDVARVDAELAGLDRRTAELEQSARKRESALRFTQGELAFERTQLTGRGEPIPDELEARLGDLEQRLAQNAAELQRNLDALLERSIELVAARSSAEDELALVYTALASQIDQILARLGDPPPLAPLIARYRRSITGQS